MSLVVSEVFLDSAVTHLAELVLDVLASVRFNISTVQNTLNLNIKRASKIYIENYIERHGLLQVLKMSHPLSLETIYVETELTQKDNYESFEDIKFLNEHIQKNRSYKSRSLNLETLSGIEIANRKAKLSVIGKPGSGKTTFLRMIGIEALHNEKYRCNCIPVFLELKRLNNYENNLCQYIEDELSIGDFPNPDEFTKLALEKGKLLILLDGLDEVPTVHHTDSVNAIKDFVNKYNKNRFIISCRKASYKKAIPGFSTVEIVEFSKDQITNFVQNWFKSSSKRETEKGSKLLELLWQEQNSSLAELSSSPLLLTFICIFFSNKARLPENRNILYRKVLEIILDDWNIERLAENDSIYQDLPPDIEMALLQEIAYDSFSIEENRCVFTKKWLLEKIDAFLRRELKTSESLNSSLILQKIEIQQGILIEVAAGLYSFSHLTMHEYLTARYISQDLENIEYLVNNYLGSDPWYEIFKLVAGEVPKADKLLNLMLKQANSISETSRSVYILRKLIHWSTQVIKLSNANNSFDLKAAIIIHALKTRDEEYAFDIFEDFINEGNRQDAHNILVQYAPEIIIYNKMSGTYSLLQVYQNFVELHEHVLMGGMHRALEKFSEDTGIQLSEDVNYIYKDFFEITILMNGSELAPVQNYFDMFNYHLKFLFDMMSDNLKLIYSIAISLNNNRTKQLGKAHHKILEFTNSYANIEHFKLLCKGKECEGKIINLRKLKDIRTMQELIPKPPEKISNESLENLSLQIKSLEEMLGLAEALNFSRHVSIRDLTILGILWSREVNHWESYSTFLKISKDEIEVLINYMKANFWIFQCQKYARRVSPEAWESIEEKILNFR